MSIPPNLRVVPETSPPLEPFVDGAAAAVPEKLNGHTAASERTPPSDQTPKTPKEGRTPGGRFAIGNKGGPGNPHARQVAKLRSLLLDVVDPDRMKRIAFKVAEMAEDGDMAAVKLLFEYVLGKPLAGMNPDAVDLDEWRLLDASPTKYHVMAALLGAVQPEGAAARLAEILAGQTVSERIRDNAPGEFNLLQTEIEARIGKNPKV